MSHDSSPNIELRRCRFYDIDLDGRGRCDDPAEITTNLRICKKHMRFIARQAGYIPRHTVVEQGKRYAESEVATLKREIERLKARIAWLERPRRKANTTAGVIYFLRVGGFVKIGWTSDLEKRMRQYQPDSVLLAVKPGTRKDETALHRKFAHLKTHGREWFALAPQVTEEADRIVRDHGTPPIVDFSARKAERTIGPRLNPRTGPKPRRYVG